MTYLMNGISSLKGQILLNSVFKTVAGPTFWAIIGFGLFYVIGQYSVYGYALVNDIRLPAEGVGFLGPLGGLFYVACTVLTVIIGYLIRKIRQALEVVKLAGESSHLWTGLDYLLPVFVLILCTIAIAIMLAVYEAPNLVVVVLVLIPTLIILYVFAQLDFALPNSLLQLVLIGFVYLFFAIVFIVHVMNGEVLNFVGYGGGRQVSVSTNRFEGKCFSLIGGKLLLRSANYFTIRPDSNPPRFVEIPVEDVCAVSY